MVQEGGGEPMLRVSPARGFLGGSRASDVEGSGVLGMRHLGPDLEAWEDLPGKEMFMPRPEG